MVMSLHAVVHTVQPFVPVPSLTRNATLRRWIGVVTGLTALMASACTPSEPAPSSLRGQALGTTWSVMWTGRGPSSDVVADAIVAELSAVDRQMSTWRDDSELSAVRGATGPIEVSEATASVVREALWLAEATGGAFDPTVQPLVELWGFHGEPLTALPSDEALAAARAQLGWERVTVGRSAAAPTVDAGGTALDLSAIAKGHAVDRVSDALSALGIGAHLVEVGGEVRAAGPGPVEGWWSVGVEAPLVGNVPGSSLVGAVRVVNAAVATSGNYRQSRVIDGVEVHHTLDPRTGRPATSGVGSATVVAPTCELADGLATALMVLGEDGLPLIEALDGVEAGLLWVEDDGLRQVSSSGFALQLVTPTAEPDAPPSE